MIVRFQRLKEVITHFVEAGFLTSTQSFEQGRMQFSHIIDAAAQAWFISANPSTLAYPFLTEAAANVINAFGSEAQKARYLPAMFSFKASGTMALTEPDVGSSLGDLMLLAQKSYVEGVLHLCLFASKLVDESAHHADQKVREDAFLRGKIQAAKYFYHRELNQNSADIAILLSQEDSCLAMQEEWF